MRVRDEEHTKQLWRVHETARDHVLLDLWRLPIGAAELTQFFGGVRNEQTTLPP